jgi:hypothetical protein
VIDFLNEIGIPVRFKTLDYKKTFLPGIKVLEKI